MFGFACSETPELMPAPIMYAHHLGQALRDARQRGQIAWLRPDGKTQVGIEYRNGSPSRIHSITLVASQTDADAVEPARLRQDLMDLVIEPVLKAGRFKPDAKTGIFVNPEGPLIGGGPVAHSGLTGRKTGMDTYGEYARHSGAALSGKDPLRVDRVGAYAARHAAKNIIAAGLAKECEVQLSYSIGIARPVSVRVRAFGSGGDLDESKLAARLTAVMDFRLGGIVRNLGLQTLSRDRGGSFYQNLAVYGHMGRTDLEVPWERTDKADALR